MSWTFSAALIEKTGAPAATRQALLRALKDQYGYVPAKDSEPMAEVNLYMRRGSGWLAMASDELLPGNDPEAECETLRHLAGAMGARILAFFNYTSDVLVMGLTDGEQVQFARCGHPDALEAYGLDAQDAVPDMFDALLPDEAARRVFHDILRSEHVFSEDICMELSELLGFGMDQLYDIGNGEVPWAALRLAKPTGNVPLLMPAAAPPVLETGIYGGGGCGFSTIHINSRGGIGEGVRIRFEALDFDPDDWRFPVAALMPPGEDLPERSRRAFRTAPERRAFPKTGTRGWELIAPECPIARGMNPLRTGKYSRKLLDYDDHSGLLLYLVFVPMPGVKPRPFAFLPGGDPMRIRPTTPAIGTLRVAIAPLQNPEGGMSVDMRVWSWQGWASGTWWMGEYAGEVLDSLDRD